MNRHPERPLARALARPGHELQARLSTVEPTPAQLEVAETALAACLAAEHDRSAAMRTPPLVRRAQAASRALGFEKSCTDEDGALLHLLAARRGLLRVGEIGTGAGVGTAWLASALRPGVPLFTCDPDERLVASAPPSSSRTTRTCASCRATGARSCRPRRRSTCCSSTGATRRTTLTPCSASSRPVAPWCMDDFFLVPPEEPDPRRDGWLEHPEVVATQVWTTPERRAIVAVRR